MNYKDTCQDPSIRTGHWQLEEYTYHALQLRPLILRMGRRYGERSAFRVGIGSLCRRASPRMIHAVVRAVSELLPGMPLHLWGVKLTLLQHRPAVPASVVRIDSAAWNGRFGTQLEAYRRSGLSQRRYASTVALPAYLAKVRAALERTAQQELRMQHGPKL
jgi:hypothetical protein